MKRCPECRRDYYDDSLMYCLEDGVALAPGVPDEPPTAMLPSTQLFDRREAAGNLPAERTRFVGRARELSECIEQLTRTRLLTITGFGGCGKTRLAIKSAEGLATSFPGGAWFVDFAPIADEGMVVPELARVFDARQEASASLLETLQRRIGLDQPVIVLDNCEHVLRAAAQLVDELLTHCPNVRIIATSREPLSVAGERVFLLQPLSVPDTSTIDTSGSSGSDAVDLFVDRATNLQSGFELTAENFATVVEVVRKLDGIPLAIELAAARLRVLSIEQVNEKLDQRFRLLAGAGASHASRHQTLHAAIQWSYDLLSDDEKNLLSALAIFAGSCDLDEITRVFGKFDEFATLDLVTRLVDKSLVIAESGYGSQKRYKLLETVRHFALAVSSDDEVEAMRSAHLQAMLALAEKASKERVVRGEEWEHILELESSNMQQALEFARRHDSETYLTLSGSLGWFWTGRSHIAEGREHLSAALNATSPEPARRERARALWAAAHIEAWCGDLETAQRWTDEALASCHQLGDDPEVALVLEGIGWSQFSSGQDEKACASFERCLKIQQASGDPVLINRAKVGLAQVLVALGRIDEARPMASEIIEFSKTHTDKRSEHFGWHYLADCALIAGDCEESLKLYQRSLALAAETGDKIEIGFEVQGVAMSLAGLGHSRQAEVLSSAVRAEMNRLGADLHVLFWDALLEKYLARAREDLGPTGVEDASREGASMAFADAISTALAANVAGKSLAPDARIE